VWQVAQLSLHAKATKALKKHLSLLLFCLVAGVLMLVDQGQGEDNGGGSDSDDDGDGDGDEFLIVAAVT